MADTYDGLFDRVRIRYGLTGGFDHQSEYIVSQSGSSPSSCLPYTGFNLTPGFSPITVVTDPDTIVDWANMVAFGMRQMFNDLVYINSIIIEEIDQDMLVTAIKPCVLDPLINPDVGYPAAAGLKGQYLLFTGYTAVGRTSKRMLGGISGKYNGMGDSFVANPAGGGGDPDFQAFDYLNRLQGIQVGGFDVQHWGETSQLDVDNELVPIVSNFSYVVLHGQNKRWRKRFNY